MLVEFGATRASKFNVSGTSKCVDAGLGSLAFWVRVLQGLGFRVFRVEIPGVGFGLVKRLCYQARNILDVLDGDQQAFRRFCSRVSHVYGRYVVMLQIHAIFKNQATLRARKNLNPELNNATRKVTGMAGGIWAPKFLNLCGL